VRGPVGHGVTVYGAMTRDVGPEKRAIVATIVIEVRSGVILLAAIAVVSDNRKSIATRHLHLGMLLLLLLLLLHMHMLLMG